MVEPIVLDVVKTYRPGEAPLERLPVEISGEIGTPFQPGGDGDGEGDDDDDD